jgi:hypothetical protein
MSGQSQVFSESIDDVLTAVQETPRGRWFLDAYSARVKSEGTSSILNAIAKLESNLGRLANSGASVEMLEKARSAIAAARQEISAVEPQLAKLSTEAQLFSNLADLSRKAFSGSHPSPNVGKGVERALKLVADLDRDLNEPSKPNQNTVEFTAPPKPPQQYFKQDDEIFEPAPSAVPTASVKSVEIPDMPNKGAKLTIRRTSAESPATGTETNTGKSKQSELAEATITEPAPPEASRIVIIRRKADEAVSVPLIDADPASEVSAA